MTGLYTGPLATLSDARDWLDYAVRDLQLNFHWDTRADEYENLATREATFTAAESERFEEQLLRAMDLFYAAGLDPYAEACDVLNGHLDRTEASI